jgi:hypothetical protein
MKTVHFFVAAFTAASTNLAFAQANPWIALASKVGNTALCTAQTVPGGLASPKPTTQDHRFALYLRCEAKGGKDEFTKSSCCDHLTPGDAKNIGVCPDNPVNVIVPIRDAFKLAVKC